MRYLFFVIFIFFSACSIKNIKSNSQSVFVNINTDLIKTNDQGFLYKNNKNIKLELYKLGQLFFLVNINNKICINKICYDKKIFNKKFFKKQYYDTLLEDILNKKAIYNGKNLIKTSCGFTQEIDDIKYMICNDEIYFKNKNSKFIIKYLYF